MKLFKWVTTAVCALPLAAMAVKTAGYTDFGDTAGVVLWRGTEANFHESTVIDVAEDGSLGQPYAMTADQSATSWQRFASNQSAYVSPGKVLVYDSAGTGDGYKYNPNCTFGPLSFGGMWVKTLAINGLPFSILGSGDRTTEFGASGNSTLFKFDASYTINRQGTTTFYGDATVDIAQGATFTAQAYSGQAVAVDSAATLKLKGAGTLAVTTMNVNGTLDLSETTRPAINGNVVLGGTIVLPAGTEVSTESPFTVCSGTLSCANAFVKIGSAEAVEKHVTVSGGAITGFGDPVYEYTENYPTVVPAGQIFTFIGGETAATATTASGVTVSGTLKTRGYISLTGLTTAKESLLEVVDGTATVTASAKQALSGDITIDAGATMVNGTNEDALNYGWGVYVNVYGTLDMGSTRWTVGSNAYIHLYGNAQIIGAGQGSNGAIDITSSNVSVIAHGDSAISANMRVRTQDASIEVEEGKTLTISGLINDGVSYSQPGSIKKKGSGTLVLTTAPTFTKALKLEAGALELGGTAVAADVTVTSSSATVVAAENAVLTGDLTFVAHVPSAANKALIVSDAFTGKVILNGDFGSSNYVSLSGLGNAVTLKDFTGFLNQGWDATNVKITIEGTFTQNNGWSGSDSDVTQNAVYIAELLGSGTMTQSGAQKQSYIVGNIANFAGTFNFAKSRIKSNNNAVLDKAQTVATLTVTDTLTVNGGSLTGNLVASNIVVTVDGTPAVGDVLVPVTGTVSVSGTVTVNGDEVTVECVAGEGVKLAADSTVTITVPAVANTTVSVVASEGDVVDNGDGTYTVAADSVVTVTYAAADGYAISGKTEYTIDTANATTFELDESTQIALAVARVRNTTTNQNDSYASLATAVAATGDGSHASQVVLLANVDEAEVTVSSAIMLMGNYTISSDITVSDGGALQVMQPTLAGTLTIEDGGAYVTSGGSLATVVAKDGAAIQLTTLSTETAPLAIANLTVEGDLTVVASWFGATRGTDYKAISYLTANATLAQGANIDGAAEWSADSYTDGNNTIVTLAITAVATVDGVYYDDAQDAVDAAVASGEPVSFLVAPGTVKLGAGETLVVSGATLPTVVLDDGLTTPPYEIAHTIDTENLTNTYAVKAYVAQITRSEYSQELGPQNVTYKFESIAEAVAGANAGETIKVIADNTMTGNAIAFAKSLTLDLNGFTTTHAGNGHAFEPTSSATFTITDTSDGAAGKVVSASKIVLSGSPCTFTLTAGTLQSDSVPVYIWGNGPASERVVNINGGKLVCGSNSNADSCIMVSSGTIRMSAGVIESVCCGFEGTEVNVSGGNVTVGVDKVFRRSTDRASGGTFNRDVSEYCVSGKICVPNGDGTYTVRAGTWIAQVGSTKYESLAAAVAAAEAGQTVTMLADDRVSFTEDNLELSIDKALTINGAGYTIYGVNDYAYDGAHDHDIYISGSGDVTITNVTLAEFGGAVANNMRTYPIWTGSAYTGTLTLDNVTVRNFNRTAFNLNGGTVVVKDCTITGDKSKDTYFQSGIEAYNANVTVQGTTTITGTGSNLVDWPEAACLQLGNPNGSVAGTGSITVTGGTFTGDYGIIVASNASEVVSVTGGTFNGVLEVEDGEGGSLAISGGTFNAVVPEEYLAEGYEVLDNGDGTYGVREDKGWIYAAPGYWNYTGTWSEGATLGEEKVTIEDGATYTASEASDGQLVTLDMTLSFDGANDDDDDFGDAKAAIRLGAGETEGTYVFQLYTYEGSAATWKNATGFTPTVETDYNVLFVLDLTNKTYTASIVSGSTTNALSVGGSTTIAFANQNNATPVQQIDFVGSGTVSSIEGSYEDAPAPVDEFVNGQEIGSVTLDTAQATWLNNQNNYAVLRTKIESMSQAAFDAAYLLNLDITGDFSYDFKVSNINVAGEDVTLTVSLTRTGALANKINGTVALTGTDELGKTFATISEAVVTDDDFSDNGSTTTITLKTGGAKFFQPTIE